MATGKDESADAQAAGAVEGSASLTPEKLSKAVAAVKTGGPRAEEEAKAESEATKGKSKGEGEAEEQETEQEEDDEEAGSRRTPQLPWDSERQRRNQEMANLRKENAALHAQQTEILSELRALRRGEKPDMGLDDAVRAAEEAAEALESLAVPDDWDEDQQKAAYAKQKDKLVKNLKAANTKVRELSAKVTHPKPEPKAAEPAAKAKAEAAQEAEPKETDRPSRKDFLAILAEADKRHSKPGLRDRAAPEVLKELKAAGWGPENVPSKALLRELVFRVYAEQAAKAPTEKATSGAKAKAAAEESEEHGGVGLRRGKMGLQPGQVFQPRTVRQIAEEMKSALRR